MSRIVEIRIYKLKQGTREEFHRLVVEFSLPMLARWNLDVVRSGPSLHDSDTYYLMRSFADMAERQSQEEAFYGSAEWRQGPRERMLPLIDSYEEAVFEAGEAAIDALRS